MRNYKQGNGGHAKGHVRDAFLDATLKYLEWEDGEPSRRSTSKGDRSLSLAPAGLSGTVPTSCHPARSVPWTAAASI